MPLVCPQPGTWPTTQAWDLTWNRTGYLLVCRPVPKPLSHTSQGRMCYIRKTGLAREAGLSGKWGRYGRPGLSKKFQFDMRGQGEQLLSAQEEKVCGKSSIQGNQLDTLYNRRLKVRKGASYLSCGDQGLNIRKISKRGRGGAEVLKK